ncbi:hypothetical protein ACFWMQ_04040 [Streptomyces sp. NPDC058372]|uniref:hypothetical protein n=1 Tax=unclassified Streptomyces TaxID=2593676 RepID=UPI0036625F84
MDLSNLGMEHTNAWVDLPYAGPDFDLDSWVAEETARIAERYAAEGQRADTRRIARALRAVTKDSATREPLGAFALYLGGFDMTLALVELDAILPDETAPEVTPQWVADHMAVDEVGPPQIEYTDLPLGPAVRIRQNLYTGKKRLFRPRAVLRTLVYGVQPKNEKGLIRLLCSWDDFALDEVLVPMVDEMAESLTL